MMSHGRARIPHCLGALRRRCRAGRLRRDAYAEGEVYGFLPPPTRRYDGTWAELIVVPEDNFVARKPPA